MPDSSTTITADSTIEFSSYRVSFKWGCWSADSAEWEFRNPTVYKALRDLTFASGEGLTLYCHSTKETRFGHVCITCTPECVYTPEGGYTAAGVFSDEWDDANDLADTLATVLEHPEFANHEPFVDFVADNGPRNDYGALGYTTSFKFITASTLEELLRLVDKQEEHLIEESEDVYYKFQLRCKTWMNENPLEINE